MKKLLLQACALFVALTACSAPAPTGDHEDRDALLAQVAAPSVQVKRTVDAGSGSGVVVFQNETYALVLTAAHVVLSEDGSTPPVMVSRRFPDVAPTPGQIVQMDGQRDLALVRTAPVWPRVASVISTGGLSRVGWGSRVVIFGHPLGVEEGMITEGRITSTNSGGRLRYSAPSCYGNSGGGVFVFDDGRWRALSIVQRIAWFPSGPDCHGVYYELGWGAHPLWVLDFLEVGRGER